MHRTDIDHTPAISTLQQFAALWLIAFGALAVWHGWVQQRHVLGAALAVAALAIGLIGLMRPQAVRWLFVAWMVLAMPISWMISQVLLAVVYYIVFAPLATLFRVTGRDLLRLRSRRSAATCWQPRPSTVDVRRYFRQF